MEKKVTLPDASTRKALLVQLYARLDSAELRPDGALLSGREVQIKTVKKLLNGGIIQSKTVTLSVSQDIHNTSSSVDLSNNRV